MFRSICASAPWSKLRIPLIAVFLGFLMFSPPSWATGMAEGFAPAGPGSGYRPTGSGTQASLPSLEAFRLDGQEIVLDGVLDEDAWAWAESGWEFRQHDPDRGAEASVPTTFKVVYDDDALYFGVACWENDMDDVASYLGRRDDIQASDIVSIYLDPYHDRTTGYNFRVNPAGVQYDAYMYDNGSRDGDWNAVWQSAVSHDSRGWYVEVRIPFSAVRFKPQDNMTWGLQVYRWLHGRGEDTGWVMWDRNVSGFVSRWGSLTGLRGIENPRKLEVLPYVVAKATDPAIADDAEDGWQDAMNMGADFKYGVTSNLTLNATFQPDFGQVEADPATLNLSPFETYFAEKRPFFTEGARFFQHPDFRMFYSRRIGTGDPNSRIRGAAKLTGKIGGDFSLAVLAAATDVGVPDRAHNPFVGGDQKAYYGLVRVGKEFDEGNHSINLMGTAVRRDEDSFAGVSSPRLQRHGYSGGLDFSLHFQDRMYEVSGSAVGTIVDPFEESLDTTRPSDTRFGTGGTLNLRKSGGQWRGFLYGGWEGDQLDPNDMGFLSAPDDKYVGGGTFYYFNTDGQDRFFKNGNIGLEGSIVWLYAGNSGRDISTGDLVWEYEPGRRQGNRLDLSAWVETRHFHQAWITLSGRGSGTSKYATRTFEGRRGPLMDDPGISVVSGGFTSDWRKPLSLELDAETYWGSARDGLSADLGLRWNQNQHLSHSLGFGMRHNVTQAQWMTNRRNDGSQPGVTGIGGVDHVFGELDQVIWDLTWRSSLLFNRDQSLQMYLQPYLTYGDYRDPRWLATPDSFDLRPYDLDAAASDFHYAALNLNLVYRWEYRPGSTLFLVWTHSKDRYDERSLSGRPDTWTNDFTPAFLVDSEPENTFLAKLSYWFSI